MLTLSANQYHLTTVLTIRDMVYRKTNPNNYELGRKKSSWEIKVVGFDYKSFELGAIEIHIFSPCNFS